MISPADPITLRAVTAPNRVWMSPMCQYSAPTHGSEMGHVTDWHVSHLEMRAVGGAGLVMTEATAIAPEGRVSPGDLGIWSDDQIPGLTRIAAAIRRHGAVPAIQLGHAGPKASTLPPWEGRHVRVPVDSGGWIPWAPSATPDGPPTHGPTADELARIPELFADATRRALRAGFEAVEIHAAHGYLLHAFLSPLTNLRTDEHGADRALLLEQTVSAVRSTWPADRPLMVRVSATDWLPEGLAVEDVSAALARVLPLGVDLVDVSSAGLAPASIDLRPGYQVPLAEAVKRLTGAVVATVGLIEEADLVAEILGTGQADVVMAGRAMLRDPFWARRVLRETGSPAAWPPQYAWTLGPAG